MLLLVWRDVGVLPIFGWGASTSYARYAVPIAWQSSLVLILLVTIDKVQTGVTHVGEDEFWSVEDRNLVLLGLKKFLDTIDGGWIQLVIGELAEETSDFLLLAFGGILLSCWWRLCHVDEWMNSLNDVSGDSSKFEVTLEDVLVPGGALDKLIEILDF